MLLAGILGGLFRAARCLIGVSAPFAGRVRSTAAAVAIRTDHATFGLGRFFDGFFALLDLCGKGRLRGLLRDRRGRLSVTRYGCGGWGC
jgi:hypothetical protein